MHNVRRWAIMILMATLLLVGSIPIHAQIVLRDISTSWAREPIEALVSRGVISGYPDETFRPDRPVTRAEFAKMITHAFSLEPVDDVAFSDIGQHWARESILRMARAGVAQGYPDGTFRPDRLITRAELVSMLVRVLKLHDVKAYTESPSFSDLDESHWAFDAVETASRLKILPPYVRDVFAPSQPANRAETAAMIYEATRLQIARGTLDYLHPESRLIGVQTPGGARDFTLMDDTVVHRNTNVVGLDQLVVGDAIYVVSDRFGSPRFVKTNGIVTQQDVLTKVSSVTRGLFTPTDIQAIIRGDWHALGESLKSTIYDRLLELGATPVEAAAIMSQDWGSLAGYARDRLAQIVGEQLGITTDLAYAVMDQDWARARELAQMEAVQHLLGHLLLQQDA